MRSNQKERQSRKLRRSAQSFYTENYAPYFSAELTQAATCQETRIELTTIGVEP